MWDDLKIWKFVGFDWDDSSSLRKKISIYLQDYISVYNQFWDFENKLFNISLFLLLKYYMKIV